MQVIDLLDERDVLLRSAGVHILSFMIVRHSKFVQKYILEPIQSPLLPSKDQITTSSTDIISSDELIEGALQRFDTITSNPSPILISMLFRPLLFNLFLLSVYTQNTFHAKIRGQVTQFLVLYLKSSSSAATDVLYLVERMLRTSIDEGWIYAPGENGGIAIRKITVEDTHELGFDEISTRVSIIIEILKEASSDVKSEIFVGIIRQWLSPHKDNPLLYTLSFSPIILI